MYNREGIQVHQPWTPEDAWCTTSDDTVFDLHADGRSLLVGHPAEYHNMDGWRQGKFDDLHLILIDGVAGLLARQ